MTNTNQSFMLDNSICEEMLKLVLHTWYFTGKPTNFSSLTSSAIVDKWRNTWFAKGASQKKVDAELSCFDVYIDLLQNYIPTTVEMMVAMIILFDQVPRNIFRGTAKAYSYDHIALTYAKQLVEKFETLPFCFKLTVVISLVHSENLSDHKIIKDNFDKIQRDPRCDPCIAKAIYEIARNHRERIELFGRIPERNKFLGRVTTPHEAVYMSAFS